MRVVQNKEPLHFLSHFKYNFHVKNVRGNFLEISYRAQGSRFDKIDVHSYKAMFQIRALTEDYATAFEVDLV